MDRYLEIATGFKSKVMPPGRQFQHAGNCALPDPIDTIYNKSDSTLTHTDESKGSLDTAE